MKSCLFKYLVAALLLPSAAYVWSSDLAAFNADGASAGGSTVSFGTSTAVGTTTATATITGMVPAKLFVALKATQTP